jgi:iron complex transport system substrate-binding protein
VFRKLLFVMFPIILVLSGCVPTPASNQVTVSTQIPTAEPSINLTDGMGRVITLSATARSIVSLAPANTEILFAIGAGAQVVGRDSFSDYPEAAKSVQDIGGSMGKYNNEAIVALHPDLVLAGAINPPELVASLEQLGLKVYFLSNPTTLEGMYTNVETVARLTGHLGEATALVKTLKDRVTTLDEKILPLSFAPTVYYELDASNPTKPYTGGPGSFVDMLIRRAGGINVGATLQGEWAQISMEELLVQNPAFIILGDSAYGETPEKVAARPGWEALTAVKNHHVYTFDDNLVSRPGPRWVDGLEALAKLLHPGLFK